MLFVSVLHPDLVQAIPDEAEGVELRLDLFPVIDLEFVKKFLEMARIPVMLTLRKKEQGGKFQGTESEREALIEELLALQPPYFDLESEMRPSFLEEIFKKHQKTKFILSYHNFESTPPHLDAIYHSMAKYPAFGFKIAAMAHSSNDALRMLLFVKKHPRTSVICMGEKSAFARVLGKVVGNQLNYASIDGESQTAPGQLTAQELEQIYHYSHLNPETAIYGLIGDPVAHSRGHLHHNAVFKKRHLNAVYVKMAVKPQELSEFILLAKQMKIHGLSVTMPLKEKILPFLNEMDEAVRQIGASNTLLFKEDWIAATNTDGPGALDAIEKKEKVKGKKVVLLGAGGAARAIAFEARNRGADVLILNRTVEKAKELASLFGCQAGGLDEMPTQYDIIVNCSPTPMPIDPEKILPHKIAMDIVTQETPFLKAAAEKQCHLIYGIEMFVNQAERQTQFWLSE